MPSHCAAVLTGVHGQETHSCNERSADGAAKEGRVLLPGEHAHGLDLPLSCPLPQVAVLCKASLLTNTEARMFRSIGNRKDTAQTIQTASTYSMSIARLQREREWCDMCVDRGQRRLQIYHTKAMTSCGEP
eukprot:1855611-Prymnesium_polylepis.1